MGCCAEESSFLPKAEVLEAARPPPFTTTQPLSALLLGAPDNLRNSSSGETHPCPSAAPAASGPMAHPSPVHRGTELVGRGVRDWAPGTLQREEASVLLLLARLFSSNKKVAMTHSIKKQKQSCNLLKGSCLDARSEVCKRRKVSCRSHPVVSIPPVTTAGQAASLPRGVYFLGW